MDLRARPTTEADGATVRAFLESHVETSVFLLSGLRDFGPTMGESPMSGNYHVVEDRGAIAGVFCLTRKGDLLAQTAGRTDLAAVILDTCAAEPVKLSGVIAEWRVAQALWREQRTRPGFRPAYESESVVYRRPVTESLVAPMTGLSARALAPSDFEIWEPIDRAFHAEEGLAVLTDSARRRRAFDMRAAAGCWMGVFDEDALVGTACMNASYRGVGQIGGLYTSPASRRRGVAKVAMAALVEHHRRSHALELIVLFAAVTNVPARQFYESLGFESCGAFGLLFGGYQDSQD